MIQKSKFTYGDLDWDIVLGENENLRSDAEQLLNESESRVVSVRTDLFSSPENGDGDLEKRFFIAAVFAIIASCSKHTFLLITEHAGAQLSFFKWVQEHSERGKEMFPLDPPEWLIWQMIHVAASRIGVSLPPHHGGLWPLENCMISVSWKMQCILDDPRARHYKAQPFYMFFRKDESYVDWEEENGS